MGYGGKWFIDPSNPLENPLGTFIGTFIGIIIGILVVGFLYSIYKKHNRLVIRTTFIVLLWIIWIPPFAAGAIMNEEHRVTYSIILIAVIEVPVYKLIAAYEKQKNTKKLSRRKIQKLRRTPSSIEIMKRITVQSKVKKHQP